MQLYMSSCTGRLNRHNVEVGWVQVAWGSGSEAQTLWQAVQGLLEYPHIWVRKASSRLLGLVLASPSIGELSPHPGAESSSCKAKDTWHCKLTSNALG